MYISGKISGCSRKDVEAKFKRAEFYLEGFGYKTVSPLKNGIPSGFPRIIHMICDIFMMFFCDSIYMLSDWQDSKGAKLENKIAYFLGKAVFFEETFVNI